MKKGYNPEQMKVFYREVGTFMEKIKAGAVEGNKKSFIKNFYSSMIHQEREDVLLIVVDGFGNEQHQIIKGPVAEREKVIRANTLAEILTNRAMIFQKTLEDIAGLGFGIIVIPSLKVGVPTSLFPEEPSLQQYAFLKFMINEAKEFVAPSPEETIEDGSLAIDSEVAPRILK